MRNQKLTAVVLAGALSLSALAVGTVSAGQETSAPPQVQTIGAVQDSETLLEQTAPVALSNEGGALGTQSKGSDSVSFDQISEQMRGNNLNLLALEESIAALEAMDYDQMTEAVQAQIEKVAETQSKLLSMSTVLLAQMELMDKTIPGFEVTNADRFVLVSSVTISTATTAMSMEQATTGLKTTLEELESGKMQADNEAIIRQLRNAQNQMVMAAETMYTTLVNLEMSRSALLRGQAALERTAAEMELRYQFGQISALNLQQVKSGQTSLDSSRQTLETNISILKDQLALMLGKEPDGQLSVQPLNRVGNEALNAMDLNADLERAKGNSYALFAAQRSLEEAKAQYEQAKDSEGYQLEMAKHSWQGAQYTYQAAVQNFEAGFRTLSLQVKDCAQQLRAAETARDLEKASFAAVQLKYSQGSVSKNAMLKAQDDLSSAQDSVDSAALNLFTTYRTYTWAVEHGILN